MRWRQNLALGLTAITLTAITLTACGGNPAGRSGSPASPAAPAAWTVFRHLPGVVDLAGPGAGGTLVVAAAGRLNSLERSNASYAGP